MDGSSSSSGAVKLAPITETQVSDASVPSQLPGWAKHIIEGCVEKGEDGHECHTEICVRAERKSFRQRPIIIL